MSDDEITHSARVTELLEANNREVERRLKAEAASAKLRCAERAQPARRVTREQFDAAKACLSGVAVGLLAESIALDFIEALGLEVAE